MSKPALEVADILRAQGNRFLERYQSSISYQQLKAFRAVLALSHRLARRPPRRVFAVRLRNRHVLQLVPQPPLSQVPGAGPRTLDRSPATGTAPHRLLPRRVHRSARTQPSGTDEPGALLRSAVRGQFRDPAGSRSRSEAARCRHRRARHPAHLGAEHPAPSAYPLCHSSRRTFPRPSALDPHLAPRFLAAHSVLRNRSATSSSTDWTPLPQGTARLPRASSRLSRIGIVLRNCCERLPTSNGSSYAKPPFGGPEHVLRYLGRYTHRIAISNHRLLGFDGERVTFRWKDYAHGGKQRIMTLETQRVPAPLLPSRAAQGLRAHPPLRTALQPLPQPECLPLARRLLAPDGRDPLSAARPTAPHRNTLRSGTVRNAADPCASHEDSPLPSYPSAEISTPHDHQLKSGPATCSTHAHAPLSSRLDALRCHRTFQSIYSAR